MEGFSLAMVTAASKIDDSGYLFLAWQGIKALRERYGFPLEVIEVDNASEAREPLRYISVQGTKLVWLIGHGLTEVGLEAASKFRHTLFAFLDAEEPVTLPNTLTLTLRVEEASYLAGIVAGKTTQTNRVGFLGGLPVPTVHAFRNGFFQGVAASNPAAQTQEVYSGSFLSYEKGRLAARTLFEMGCDVFLQAAGASGKGAIREAKMADKRVIGTDMDQSYLAPAQVLTSIVKKIDTSIYKVTEGVMTNGSYVGLQNTFGWKDGVVRLAGLPPNLPGDIREAVALAEKGLQEGQIVLKT